MKAYLKKIGTAGLLLYIISFLKKFPFVFRIFKFIQNNPLYKGVFILGSGTAIAQLIGIISMPIITRLYSPSDLGILAVYSSILAIIGIGASLRYEFALGLPKSDEDAANLLGLCLILLCITTVIFILILIIANDFLFDIFNLNQISDYLWFLPLGIFGMALYNILNYYAIRNQDYRTITCTKINQGIGGAVCKIFLGLFSFGPIGLIIGHIISQTAGVGTLVRSIWNKKQKIYNSVSINSLKTIAKTYKNFPFFHFPASIMNTISLQLPPLMLLLLFNSQIVGFYSLAYMLLILPGSFISQSMGQAYLGEASKMVRDGSKELRYFYLETLKHLSLIGLPLIGLPALCMPVFISVIFGEAWKEAGWYCWILGAMVITGFVVSPTSILSIYGNNHWNLIWDVIRTGGVFFGFYICYFFKFPVIITLFIYSIIMIMMYFVLILIVLYVIEKFTQNLKTEVYDYIQN